MGKKKKRQKSDGETPDSQRRTKEAKISSRGEHSDIIADNSAVVNGSYLSLLNDSRSPINRDNHLNNNGTMAQIPQSMNGTCYSPYVNMPMGYPVSAMSLNNASTPMNMQQTNSTSVQTGANQNQTSKPVNYADLMDFLNSKFEDISTRLGKLESLEQKVGDIDNKISKLWSDLDKRVSKNEEKISDVREAVEAHDFDIEKTKDEVQSLKSENRRIKDEVVDMQAKAMMTNLIIGGIAEKQNETMEQTKECVIEYFKKDLKIPDEEIGDIKTNSVKRLGPKKNDKPRNILVVFQEVKMKDYVKSFKDNVDSKASGKYMHDQYPQEIVEQRRKLIPIMLKARKAKKDAFIKYNKLFVDGKLYTNGEFGKVA